MTEPKITPPPELVQQWASESLATQNLCNRAAQWGADTELEACCEWAVNDFDLPIVAEQLRAARRPKPSSLKAQALKALAHILNNSSTELGAETIRRALESIPDD